MNRLLWKQVRRDSGFTLVEVLISLVIAALGITALLQLQGVFLQSASDAEKRAVATALAEKKFEELRSFDNTSEYSLIGSGSTSSTETVVVGSTSMDYSVDWSDITPWVSSGSASISNSDYKEVTINVTWDSGESSLAMSSLIAKIDPNISGLIEKSGFGGDIPEVEHTPGGVPDVVPIDVGGGKKRETSKPLPDVEQSDESTEVRFTTVTYDDTDYSQVDAEEFVTVNCFCVLDNSNNDGVTPYHHVFDAATQTLDVSAGNIVTDVKTATPYTSGNSFTQSRFCTRCCAEHHDSPSYDYAGNGVPRYDNTAASGEHVHYKFSPSTPSADPPGLAVAGNGDTYLEACRFRRVDGIFRLFPDWEILDLNVMPYSYLASSASSSLSSYQQYVADRIQDEIFVPLGVSQAASSLTGRDFDTFEAATTQVLSRGVYYDDMSYDASWVDYMTNTVAASSALVTSQDWLRYVPFYEINMTLLTTWESASTAVAEVTSENIDTVIDESIDYYGVYSRGRVTGGTAGSGASTSITASTKTDNTGILGNTYANPSSYIGLDNRIKPSPAEMSASLAVTLVDPGSLVTLSGQIAKAANGVNLNQVTVSVSSGSCDAPVVTGDTAAYNCYVTENAGSVTVSPTTISNNDYLDPTVAVGSPSEVTVVTAGTANGSNGAITLTVGTSGVTGLDFNLTK